MKWKTLIYVGFATFFSCTVNHQESDAYGNFEAREILVAAKANGQVINLGAEEGMSIKKGTRAGLIDTTQPSLKKQQLVAQKRMVLAKIAGVKAKIKVQEEQKNNLLREKKRLKQLIKDQAATEKQLDDINGKINVAEQQIQATKAQYLLIKRETEMINKQIEQIQVNISDCIINNPLDGTVLEKYIEPSEFVNMGKPLYKIADLNIMELRVYVSGDQLPRIKIGQKVNVLIDKNDKEYTKLEGTVSWIASSAEFTPKIIQTKKERVNLVYAVKIKVNNDGRIKIGMPGEVVF